MIVIVCGKELAPFQIKGKISVITVDIDPLEIAKVVKRLSTIGGTHSEIMISSAVYELMTKQHLDMLKGLSQKVTKFDSIEYK